jgi:hypothetical protein
VRIKPYGGVTVKVVAVNKSDVSDLKMTRNLRMPGASGTAGLINEAEQEGH